jgi:hypothetical protein
MATILGSTGVTFPDLTVQTSAAVGGTATTANTQTFNSTGTWTKPSNVSRAYVQIWGAGGGGASSPPHNYRGGGGGAYIEFQCPVSYLAATVTATVGAGGTAGGGTGGTSSFITTTAINGKTTFSAYGGQGGNAGTQLSASGGGSLGTPTGLISGFDLGATGGNYVDFTWSQGNPPAIWGGGQGAYAETSQSTYGNGGNSFFGGGGGGATSTAPGTSYYGGDGGSSGVAGTAPGGGGGAGAAGAAGRIIVTCW